MTQPTGEERFYFRPRCMYCNKNNRTRQSRRGRYWKCRHCGEINPGPGMVQAMISHMTQPSGTAARAKDKQERAAKPAAPATVAVTTIKGTELVAAPAKKKPVKAAAAGKPTPTPPPAKSAESKGFLQRLGDAVYG